MLLVENMKEENDKNQAEVLSRVQTGTFSHVSPAALNVLSRDLLDMVDPATFRKQLTYTIYGCLA